MRGDGLKKLVVFLRFFLEFGAVLKFKVRNSVYVLQRRDEQDIFLPSLESEFDGGFFVR